MICPFCKLPGAYIPARGRAECQSATCPLFSPKLVKDEEQHVSSLQQAKKEAATARTAKAVEARESTQCVAPTQKRMDEVWVCSPSTPLAETATFSVSNTFFLVHYAPGAPILSILLSVAFGQATGYDPQRTFRIFVYNGTSRCQLTDLFSPTVPHLSYEIIYD